MPGAASSVSSHTIPLSRTRPEPSSQSVTGATPTPTTTMSASTVPPSSRRTRSTCAVALDGGDAHAEAEVDTVIAVQLTADHAEHRAEAAHEGRRQRLEHRHLQAAHAARRRDLRPDEAGADHDDAWPRVEAGAQVERVVDRAQHEDAVEVGRVRQRARRGAGREQRAVERQRLATLEGQEPSGGIERGGPHAQAELHVELVVRRACATPAPGAPTPPRAAASTAADGRRAGAAPRPPARSGRRSPPAAASPWPAAPPARPPPPPRFAPRRCPLLRGVRPAPAVR